MVKRASECGSVEVWLCVPEEESKKGRVEKGWKGREM